MGSTAAVPDRVPIREGLFTEPLSHLEAVRLIGSRCADCGETTLGRTARCANCGKDSITHLPLGKRGELWTYTVVRHRPPGNYRGPEPFTPFALGLVELPQGVRVMAPIEGDPSRLQIGSAVELRAYVRAGDSTAQVVTFAFATVD